MDYVSLQHHSNTLLHLHKLGQQDVLKSLKTNLCYIKKAKTSKYEGIVLHKKRDISGVNQEHVHLHVL